MRLSDDQIIALYQVQKTSCAEIARQDGRSESTIYNILKDRGVKMRDRSEANQLFAQTFSAGVPKTLTLPLIPCFSNAFLVATAPMSAPTPNARASLPLHLLLQNPLSSGILQMLSKICIHGN